MISRSYSQLVVGAVIFILLVFLVLGFYLVQEITESQRDAWNRQVVGDARLIADVVQSASDSGAAELDEILDDLPGEQAANVAVVDASGEVVAGETPREATELASRPDVAAALDGDVGETDTVSLETGAEQRTVAVPVTVSGGEPGALIWSTPLDDRPGFWNPLARMTAAALVVVALLVGAITLVMPRLILEPLTGLTAVARRVAGGDLDARADTESYDEIAELAIAFNETTHELREQLQTIDFERARLEAIVEHLNDGILIVDPRGAVRLINHTAEKLLDIGRQRALVRTYAEVVRDHELVELIRDSQRLYDPDQPLPNRFIELGQQRRAIQAFAYPIAQGDTELVIVILRDITELRRTETVRRDFVANVSHELRTPIASLKALVETLLDGALDDREAAVDFLSRMEVEVDDLARLVEELLELSRAESRRIELNRFPSDVSRLVRRVAARMEPHAGPRQISFSIDAADDLPPGDVDPERIEQVLVNLLHNAIKFSPEGSTIEIHVARGDDELFVSIADRGPGIPSEELERVFERFYKADRSRSQSGSGLGLAIARHLVLSHGGRIWAESGIRGGTTITFTVPVAGEESADAT